MPAFSLEIGGIGFRIEWEKSHARHFPLRYGFFPLRGKVRVHLTVHCGAFPHFPRERCLFELKDHWALYETNGHYLIETFHSHTKRAQFLGRFSKDFSSGNVYALPDDLWQSLRQFLPFVEARWSFPQLMRPLGQLLIVFLLSQGEGIVVHGLGVREGKEGRAFIGPSGSGKSTLAKLFLSGGGVSALSDEIVIIRKSEGAFYLHGTPWPGVAWQFSQESAPLKELFFIAHGSQNSLERLSAKEFPRLLFPQIFLTHWNEAYMQKTLEFCEELFATIPCYRFHFLKDPSAISFLKEGKDSHEAKP
ncbi:MAG: hypothetical protein ABH845_04795 [Candidatus Omnitrophota bacterium]